ncbi:unnamed protein product [Trifolium pratense]|uniref:Uncharacterized protein n=1 Tax=Trifolium pratense TaxID=57577 RepID=A0ACB0J659_TRIPR|nr:unnamed protein product [Trifolium pratense]
MFDWNDEELANIIWDEGGESDDHIVPFPEASEDLRNKKEVNQEAAACKLTKRKQPETNTDCHENLGSSSNVNNSGGLLASGYGASSWPDSSLSSAAKIDQGSMGTELSKNRGELSKLSTSREETTQHEKDAQFFQNAEEGKEQGDFVDYDWANIGSFDDLDRIFSHDDPIFGNVSLDNSDELWSAKDVSNNQAHVPLDAPSPTDALRNKSEPFEIKEEHGHCNDQSFSPSYEKISGPAYQSIQNSHTTTDNVECAGDRSKPTGKEQQIQSGNLRHQPVLSGYETSLSSVNALKSYAGSINPQTMTPQEKIEKLRRRQQMQAMLAIQKQQQVLGHQVPSTSKSVAQKCHPEIQSHLSDGTDPKIEDLSTYPPIEQVDSNTISLAIDDDFVEETILYRLQDVISKLDVTTRLCIRDSLFRLAQSATQRHYASDTSSTNKNNNEEYEVFAREESSRQNRVPDIETETNSIDRTVARLVFHRPVELTGNYSDKLESPVSTKVQCENKAANQVDFPMGCLQEEDLRSHQQFSHLGSENPCQSFEVQPMHQIKNSLGITSENASNPQEFEASQ